MNKECSIPASQIFTAIKSLLNFPYPQVCRHYVCCNLISMLESNGYPVDQNFKDLAKEVVAAHDEEALGILAKIDGD